MVIYLMEAQYQMRGLIILHLMYNKTWGGVKLGKYGSNQEAATFGSPDEAFCQDGGIGIENKY